MNFCEECQDLLTRYTESGNLVYMCTGCDNIKEAKKEDTLIAEEIMFNTDDNIKFGDLIYNASYDLASNCVDFKCPNCKIDFINILRLGVDGCAIYICNCGKKYNHNEYQDIMNSININETTTKKEVNI